MCHVIWATLPPGTDLAALRPVIDAHGLGFDPTRETQVLAQLPPGELFVRATRRYCDCGTVLGSMRRGGNAASKEAQHDREVQRLRRQGWSQAKIDRWVADKEQAVERRESSLRARGELSQSEELRTWLSFLPSLLATGKTVRVGLLYHWYGRGDGTITIHRSEMVNVRSLTLEFLKQMEEDVLYTFVAGHTPHPS